MLLLWIWELYKLSKLKAIVFWSFSCQGTWRSSSFASGLLFWILDINISARMSCAKTSPECTIRCNNSASPRVFNPAHFLNSTEYGQSFNTEGFYGPLSVRIMNGVWLNLFSFPLKLMKMQSSNKNSISTRYWIIRRWSWETNWGTLLHLSIKQFNQ